MQFGREEVAIKNDSKATVARKPMLATDHHKNSMLITPAPMVICLY
jgi:hypothetical protein